MNYEALLERARDKADAEIAAMYGQSHPYHREWRRDKLVVRYYLEYISPIPVPEIERVREE